MTSAKQYGRHALFSGKLSYSLMFPPGTDDLLDQSRLQAWQCFSVLTGIAIMILAALSAIELYRWGKRQQIVRNMRAAAAVCRREKSEEAGSFSETEAAVFFC